MDRKAGDTNNPRMLHTFEDKEPCPDSFFEYKSDIAGNHVPLIIDNGSYTCKVGWACNKRPKLIFRNLIAKARVKKEGDFNGSLIGNDIRNLESMKWNLRTQFDRDVVTHFEAQEQILDYTFSHLGIDTEGYVDHPVVMMEALCIPNSFRQGMSELLFECYGIPQVVYGVDSLFSFNYNMKDTDTALVISSGFSASHVIPIFNGRASIQNCRRINVGGMNGNIFMQRLMQLKHPGLSAAVSISRAQELIKKYTYVAPHYDEELTKWKDEDFAKDNRRTIQLPYAKPEPIVPKDPEKEREKRIKQGRRLQELNARKREEKLAQDEARFNVLRQLLPLQKINQNLFAERLKEAGIDSNEELFQEVDELRSSILARRQKMMNQSLEEPSAKKYKGEEKNPTEGMTEEEIEGLVEELRRERMEILDKRKLREQRKQELSNRKSHAAKERMRILTKLADAGKTSKKQKSEDTFGMNDEDWEVYKYISKEGGDTDDEQEQERLDEIEMFLSQHDLEFIKSRKQADDSSVDLAAYYQLHMDVERIRVPEIVFQPCIIGLEQAGLAETIEYVLKKFSAEIQDKLVQNIFVTGGNSLFPGFRTRLENEVRSMRPFKSHFNVRFAENPELDAWLGAREWVQSLSNLSEVSVTRSDYEECGEGFLREHKCSNIFFQTPSTG
eukprot:gene10676-19428_t